MFTICKNFIKVDDSLFKVIRVFREDRVLNVELIKEWLGAIAIYKKDGFFYFCEKVEDLEIIN